MIRLAKPQELRFQYWVYGVIDLGCPCGGSNLAEFARVSPLFMELSAVVCRSSLTAVGHRLQ